MEQKKFRIRSVGGNGTIMLDGPMAIPTSDLSSQFPFNLPVIDGKSPLYVTVSYVSTNSVILYLFIDEIGGVPDENYWNL